MSAPVAAARRAAHHPTVTDCLLASARAAPAGGLLAYTRKAEGELVPYSRLLARARRFATRLRAEGVEPGALVGLYVPTSVEFFVAFFGCLFARAAAVTLSLPVRVGARHDRGAERLRRIVGECDLAFLVDAVGVDRATLAPSGSEGPRVLPLAELDDGGEVDAALPAPRPDDLALVQFTSGSLSRPKGVCLTQANIAANIQAIVDAVAMNPADTIDLWIPLYHDMGLMGSLTAIASGGRLRLSSPLLFLIDPLGWLLRFARAGSTINPSPHFFFRALADAYDAERAADLDLSRWRVAFNGAEPLRAADLDRFTELFSPHGFSERTHYPVYGLAECTLAALFPPYGRAPLTVRGDEVFAAGAPRWLRARRYVSVGRPIAGHEARIEPCPVAAAQLELPPEIGELEIRGPSVTSGYLGRARESARVLAADGWLSTRDLAFRHRGEYFVCGRIKEVIIVRGENYFPEDFEALVDRAAEAAPAQVVGRAAFARSDDGAEGVGLAIELRGSGIEESREALAARVRAAASEAFGVDVELVFVPPKSIPRTTSGKLQRLRLAELWSSGALAASDPATPEARR